VLIWLLHYDRRLCSKIIRQKTQVVSCTPVNIIALYVPKGGILSLKVALVNLLSNLNNQVLESYVLVKTNPEILHSNRTKRAQQFNYKSHCDETYGSSRLKLRPLQPFVGLDATNAMRIATTAKQTALQDSCH